MPNSGRMGRGRSRQAAPEAARAVGDRFPIEEHPLRELREAERSHGEIDTTQP